MTYKILVAAGIAALSLAVSVPAMAQMGGDDVSFVGGAAMYADKTIVENAVNSPIHTTLVAAVTAAGLVNALSGAGPFTVFAPTDAAFAALPEGTVETLLLPENMGQLVKILTAHVAAGNWSAEVLLAEAEANGGSFAITTLSGDTLVASVAGGRVYIVDEGGNIARITNSDVNQSNGVIHVVNKVLLPN